MKNKGIWLDKQKAIIVTIDNGEEMLTHIDSNLESSNIGLGPDHRAKGKIQDSTYLKYEKNKLKEYFKEIASEVNDTDRLVVLGPGETGEQFRKELNSRYKLLGRKLKGVKKTDSMTDNQLKAWVRNFFEQ